MNAATLFKSLKTQKVLRALTLPDNGGFNPDKFLCVGNHNRQKRRFNVVRLKDLGYHVTEIDCPEANNIFNRYCLLIEIKTTS